MPPPSDDNRRSGEDQPDTRTDLACAKEWLFHALHGKAHHTEEASLAEAFGAARERGRQDAQRSEAAQKEKPPHLWDNPQRLKMSDAAVKLAELHMAAGRHNPRPVSPDRAAAFRSRLEKVDPETALRRIRKALEPEANLDTVKSAGEAWDAWDAERDPHKKALLQLDLALCVACLLEHIEAIEPRPADDQALTYSDGVNALMGAIETLFAGGNMTLHNIRNAAEGHRRYPELRRERAPKNSGVATTLTTPGEIPGPLADRSPGESASFDPLANSQPAGTIEAMRATRNARKTCPKNPGLPCRAQASAPVMCRHCGGPMPFAPRETPRPCPAGSVQTFSLRPDVVEGLAHHVALLAGMVDALVAKAPPSALAESSKRCTTEADAYLRAHGLLSKDAVTPADIRSVTSADSSSDPRLEMLKEARRRIRDIKIKDEHAYALGLAIGVLYQMRDELAGQCMSPAKDGK